jgi:hypothetical protein
MLSYVTIKICQRAKATNNYAKFITCL